MLTSHLYTEDIVFDFRPFKFQEYCPSEFRIDFITGGIEYSYEFHIFKGRILFEELHYYPKKRKARVFSREAGSYSHRKGTITRPTEVEVNTGAKTLFISRASSMNRPIAQAVYRFFRDEMATEIEFPDLSALSKEEFKENKPLLLKALEISDSDIVDIQLIETKPGLPVLYSFHKENPDIAFDFEKEESEGTKRLLRLLLTIMKKAIGGATIFMDEFDLKLHLRLAEFLLDAVRSSRKGQFVFTSHNPWLIDTTRLRREQIVFVNKQNDGNSEFIPLSDYQGIGNTTDIRKAYLQGRFYAVPYVGDADTLWGEVSEP